MRAAPSAAARAGYGGRLSRPTGPVAAIAARPRRPRPLRRLRVAPRTRASAAAAGDASSFPPSPPPAATRSASFPATVFNLANLIMGAGYVSVPYALACGGPLPALAALAALAFLFCATGRGLSEALAALEAQQEEEQRGQQQRQQQQITTTPREFDYADVIAEPAAAAAAVRALVSFLVLAELFGCCCCFVALGGEALAAALALAFPSILLSKAACTALAAGLMLPTLLLPDLSALAALGVLGVFAAAACALLLLGVATITTTSSGQGLSAHFTSSSSSPLVGPDFPLVLGICAFCFAGHGAFPAVRASMGAPKTKERAAFPRALSAGYASVLVLCAAVGLAGFAAFGPQVASVFPASLQAAAAASASAASASSSALALAAAVAVVLTAVNPLSAFAITLEPVGAALEARLGGKGGVGRSLPRLLAGLSCAAVAVSCPFAAELAALTGSVLTMTVSLILPGVAHALLMRRRKGGSALLPWRPAAAAVDAAAVVAGVACAAIGGKAALAGLTERLRATAAV